MDDIDLLSINTIRTLSIDAVQKANSGHPGAPMGLAPVAYAIWQNFLRYDPKDPLWPNRDRFVLSAGHASMLVYSMLHLTKVQMVNAKGEVVNEPAVSMDDVKSFRQSNSKTPGHPEYHHTTGVEATTGPLGQGVSMSVGMAIAEKWQAARYNKPGHTVIDHNIYVITSDGEMQEGIASEAASLAGHLKLDNLCWLYDSNSITLDGPASWTMSEDVGARFLAYGWNVVFVRDANNLTEVNNAIGKFHEEKSRPTLIVVESHIGYGSPNKQDSNKSHGEPLGAEEVKLTKKAYGWPEDAQFLVPDGVYENFENGVGKRGAAARSAWETAFASFKGANPDLAAEFEAMEAGTVPPGVDTAIPTFPTDAKGLATRDSAGKVENALAQHYPWLIGGSADLDGSTKTRQIFEGSAAYTATEHTGRNLHFGIREHAMGAICNGLALSKIRPYGATFLIFSDYLRPTIRLASLMRLPTIFIFTHDSISVGEDGPTHQPVEQVASLRCIPGLVVLRPGDANEAAEAWRVVTKLTHQPSCLILSRQPLPTIDRTIFAPAIGVAKGAYVLSDPPAGAKAEVILIGTGSELSLVMESAALLAKDGVGVRVVSMPSWDLFEDQDEAYKDSVFPDSIPARVAVEQGSTMGWERYTGRKGMVIGMHSFGASAPMKALMSQFGFTTEKVVEAAKQQIAAHAKV